MDGWMDEWLNRQSVLITVVWAFMNRGVLMKYERQPLTKISFIRSYRSSFYSLPYVTLYLPSRFQLCLFLDGKKRKL